MKKGYVLAVMAVSGGACLAAWGAEIAGVIPAWMMETVLVIAFPVFIVFLGLWWRASGGEEDIPFIGY
jgi:hypothetical protein